MLLQQDFNYAFGRLEVSKSSAAQLSKKPCAGDSRQTPSGFPEPSRSSRTKEEARQEGSHQYDNLCTTSCSIGRISQLVSNLKQYARAFDAPASRSSRATSAHPFAAAKWSGVRPHAALLLPVVFNQPWTFFLATAESSCGLVCSI